ARPGQGEPVALHVEALHQVQVGRVPVVVVAGRVTGGAVGDPAAGVAERVPDGRTPPVLVHRALDLVRGGRHAPQEPGREAAYRRAVGRRGAGVRAPDAAGEGRHGQAAERGGAQELAAGEVERR